MSLSAHDMSQHVADTCAHMWPHGRDVWTTEWKCGSSLKVITIMHTKARGIYKPVLYKALWEQSTLINFRGSFGKFFFHAKEVL